MFELLELTVTPEMFTTCFNQLDAHNTGEISYSEFRHWWYIKKNGKPQMDKCPEPFLHVLAERWQGRSDYENVAAEDLYDYGTPAADILAELQTRI